jgi:PAS domain S-box-containing protein
MNTAKKRHATNKPSENVNAHQRYESLIEAMRFLGDVSAKIYGLLDAEAIYHTILDEFGKSNRFSCSLLLLTEDRKFLKLKGISTASAKLAAAGKILGIRHEVFLIEVVNAGIYTRIIERGEIVRAPSSDIIKEIFPQSMHRLVPLVTNTLGLEKNESLLAPIRMHAITIGVISITPPVMFSDFIPSVKTFSQQISSALELAQAHTEQKRTEELLLASENKYRNIFQNATEGIFQTTLEGNYLSLNPAIARILGYASPEEMMEKTNGTASNAYVNPEDRKKIFAYVQQNGSITDCEVLMRKKDGSLAWISMNAHLIQDEKGQVAFYEGTLRDISDRKKIEQALRESETKFRTVVENSFEGIAFCDANGKVFYRSPSYSKIDGYLENERIGRNGFEKVHPDDLDKIKKLWLQVLKHPRTPIRAEFRTPHKDGAWRWLEATAVNMLDDEAIKAIVVTSRDVTERKLAEQQVEMFKKSVDALADGNYWFGPDGKFIYVNDAACTMLGYARQELLAMHVTDVNPPAGRERLAEVLDGIRTKGFVVLESVHRRKDGREFPVEIRTQFVQYPGNEYFCGIAVDITRRKLVEEALHESERKYRSLFESLPIGIGVSNLHGQVLSSNPAMRLITGYDSDGLDKVKLSDTFNNPEESRTLIAAIQKNGFVRNWETRLKRKNGEIYDALLNVDLIDLNGEKVHLTNVLDITERKRAAETLRRSEEKFRLLFESAGVGIAHYSPEGIVLAYNTIAAKNMNGKPEDFAGKSMFDLFPKEHAKLYLDRLKKALNSDVPHEYIDKLDLPGGTKWFHTVFTKITTDSGKAGGVQIVSTDITRQKQTEADLFETSERLSLAASSGKLGIWDWNLRSGKMVWDDRMLELYGITREAFSGTVDAWSNGLHPDDRARATEECELAIAGKKAFNTTFRVIDSDGTVKHIKADGMVIRAGDGKVIRMIGINRDISENVKTEEALRNTQKLESLGILAGGIAHDFNNLLGGIYGYIDLAREAAKSDNAGVYLSKAISTIDRSRGLTRQLLTFAKGGAPVAVVGHLFPFVRETVEFALSGSKVSCDFKIAQDLCPCNFDKNQIGQVVDNIIINAMQAMPDGGVITLSAENLSFGEGRHAVLSGGDYIRISVKDCGIGIPKEILPRIFDPFYTTKASGHGLGLATCYSIVKRHGGAIDVESEPGKGSTFHVFLPAATGSVISDSVKPAPHFTGKGVFVVMDDEEVMRETIGGMLESLGYTVLYAKNGSEAIDVIATEAQAQRTITGAIFDLTVPGGFGGKEAVTEVRKTHPTIPIFVVSGYADDPVMADPQNHGFTASIPKPFKKAELAELLKRFLFRSPS